MTSWHHDLQSNKRVIDCVQSFSTSRRPCELVRLTNLTKNAIRQKKSYLLMFSTTALCLTQSTRVFDRLDNSREWAVTGCHFQSSMPLRCDWECTDMEPSWCQLALTANVAVAIKKRIWPVTAPNLNPEKTFLWLQLTLGGLCEVQTDKICTF